jgi:DNA-binding beta-propeller fold protein YncE
LSSIHCSASSSHAIFSRSIRVESSCRCRVIARDIDLTVAVNNLDDNTADAIIDLTNQRVTSISVMQKPHDVLITHSGDAIFVSTFH